MNNGQTGLTQEEVLTRRRTYGFNELQVKEKSALLRLFQRFWGPIPWMIEAAAVLSFYAHRLEDFTIIMVLLFVNAFVDFYQEAKAMSAIAVLKKRLASFSLVLREGKWQKIEAKELVPDDIIKIKIGDIAPADVKLLEGADFLLVDQSALTGESLPVTKKAGDTLYANAIIKQGEMVAQVTATARNSFFGKTVGLVAKAEHEQKSHFQKMVLSVGNFLILLTIVMIAIIISVGIYRQEPLSELLIFSLVLTISAIPVAMPAVLTVTMAIGARILAKKEAIVSRLSAIEELAGMDILCSDKTGTLTKNSMSLSTPFTMQAFHADDLYYYAALASKAENEDPIEAPIFEQLRHLNLEERFAQASMVHFTPFDPINKRTESIVEQDTERLAVTKGAPQVILALSDVNSDERETINQKIADYANKGFRTLGVAFKKEDESSYQFVGLIALFDPPRDDSAQAIAEAKNKQVTIKMVTGDNIAVAKYISGLLQIGDDIENIQELKGESSKEYVALANVLSKAIIKVLHPQQQPEAVETLVTQIVHEVKDELQTHPITHGSVKKHESEIIALIEQASGFAEVFPEDKYFIVEKLQKAGHIVGMTGDGVNDAPALKKSDCGIAVSGATDAARAAASIVLMAPGLRVIVDAIEQARITFERMKSYTIFRIAETIRIILFMTLAIAVFQFYPVTALMIILLALLNDIPILAIAYDNTKVQEAPVRWNMHEMLILSTWLGVAGVLSSFLIFWYVMTQMHLPLEFVQSLFFVKLIVAGHATIFNTRTESWYFKGAHPSAILLHASFWSAIAGTVIAVYGFDLMEPIGWGYAGMMWLYAFVWFNFNDVVKVMVLRFYRKKRVQLTS